MKPLIREERIGAQVKGLSHAFARRFEELARQNGLDEVSIMHGWVLAFLYRNAEREVFQKDLERAFHINKSSVTSVVQLMERRGYIRRESVERDARLKKLVMTEKGRQTNAKALKTMDEVNCIAVEGLSNEEIAQFKSLVEKIRANVTGSKQKGVEAPK